MDGGDADGVDASDLNAGLTENIYHICIADREKQCYKYVTSMRRRPARGAQCEGWLVHSGWQGSPPAGASELRPTKADPAGLALGPHQRPKPGKSKTEKI